MRILVTGGAGFIGSALIRRLIQGSGHEIFLNLDKLTYAGSLGSLNSIADSPRYRFLQVDVCDRDSVARAIAEYRPQVVTHLAAESHVDRSIDDPGAFIQTNIVGTYTILMASLKYWQSLSIPEKACFRFHHISTDEVYGSLGVEGRFVETTPYDPRSPYSASKAGSDHLVSAWGHTYGLPILITNCSNNYGPFHFPEKLIPLMIVKCLAGERLPVYGAGENIRDWLYVDDHAAALQVVFEKGIVGQTYNIGSNNERSNLEVVKGICLALDELHPRRDRISYVDQISFVKDRPGHDARYAINSTKINKELGWKASVAFDAGLMRTVQWYLDNKEWWRPILDYRGQAIAAASLRETA